MANSTQYYHYDPSLPAGENHILGNYCFPYIPNYPNQDMVLCTILHRWSLLSNANPLDFGELGKLFLH